MKKVLLLSMPMGALERPSLGLSLLKARLDETGVECDVRYLTFAFAEFIGQGNYQWMCYELPYTAFAGDWSFTQALYGERPELEQEYIQKILREVWQLTDEDIRRILYIRSMVSHFLDHCMAAVSWSDYAIVGFTSTFEQNIASLALAKRIKEAYPKISIVFGGANWEAGMGHELHRRFSFVDYVCSGEAEESFPALVQRIRARTPMNGGRARYRASSIATVSANPSQPAVPILFVKWTLCRCRISATILTTSASARSLLRLRLRCSSRRHGAAGGEPSRTALSADLTVARWPSAARVHAARSTNSSSWSIAGSSQMWKQSITFST